MKGVRGRFGVRRHTLLFTAGAVWIAAGGNILRVGIASWSGKAGAELLTAAGALFVFAIFFFLIFRRLLVRHTRRMLEKEGMRCPFSFFDAKGWIVMAGMIVLGVVVRSFGLLPPRLIAAFYTGLGAALVLTGALFVRRGWLDRSECAGGGRG